jgi:hypothetical protein
MKIWDLDQAGEQQELEKAKATCNEAKSHNPNPSLSRDLRLLSMGKNICKVKSSQKGS